MYRWGIVLGLACLCWIGCKTTPRKDDNPSTIPRKPARIDYHDTDAFDAWLKTQLTARTPVVLVTTGQSAPTWEGRLNLWLDDWAHVHKDAPPPEPGADLAALLADASARGGLA